MKKKKKKKWNKSPVHVMPEIHLQAAFKMPPLFVSFIPKSCGGDIPHEMATKCHLIYIEEWSKRKDLVYVNIF